MTTSILSTVGSFLYELLNGSPAQTNSELCKSDSMFFGDGFLA